MFRRGIALLVCLGTLATSVSAATPVLLARTSRSVQVSRGSDENPVKEIAKSIYWGAVGGAVIGGAIMLADKGSSAEPLRWGVVVGAFAGLAVGTYFVMTRPQPEGLLELEHGRLTPAAALGAGGVPAAGVALHSIDAVPGGARVRLVAVKF